MNMITTVLCHRASQSQGRWGTIVGPSFYLPHMDVYRLSPMKLLCHFVTRALSFLLSSESHFSKCEFYTSCPDEDGHRSSPVCSSFMSDGNFQGTRQTSTAPTRVKHVFIYWTSRKTTAARPILICISSCKLPGKSFTHLFPESSRLKVFTQLPQLQSVCSYLSSYGWGRRMQYGNVR